MYFNHIDQFVQLMIKIINAALAAQLQGYAHAILQAFIASQTVIHLKATMPDEAQNPFKTSG
ncbi:hypothetical protein GCM10023151_09680 [Kangiella marina]|uniref:Uncharacterized protein n=1 Tax=Kangiella marina TaxID=1079178 RepID=A0ABP8IHY8_9GAMM